MRASSAWFCSAAPRAALSASTSWCCGPRVPRASLQLADAVGVGRRVLRALAISALGGLAATRSATASRCWTPSSSLTWRSSSTTRRRSCSRFSISSGTSAGIRIVPDPADTSSMAALRSSSVEPRGKNRSAPPRPRTPLLRTLHANERITTGTCASSGSSLMRRHSAKPSSLGRSTSLTITWGASRRAISRASTPERVFSTR